MHNSQGSIAAGVSSTKSHLMGKKLRDLNLYLIEGTRMEMGGATVNIAYQVLVFKVCVGIN